MVRIFQKLDYFKQFSSHFLFALSHATTRDR